MVHFILLYHLLVFVIGISNITIGTIAFFKLKKDYFLTGTLCMTALSIIVAEQAFSTYIKFNKLNSTFLSDMLSITSWLGVVCVVYNLPKLVHELFDEARWDRRKIVFLLLGSCSFLMMILYQFMESTLWLNISLVILYSSILYFLGIAFRNRKNIKQPIFRRMAMSYIILTLIFVPLLLLDTKTELFFQDIVILQYGLLSTPTFYLAFNVLTFIWMNYILKNAPELLENKANDDEILDSIIKKFLITSREKDVMLLLINGYSYIEISEGLGISLSTVKSHTQNVYRKLDVNSKIELINLIQSYK